MLRKYKIKLNYSVVAITLCICVGIVFYAGNLASDNVVTSAIPMENSPIIVLDAGHGGMDGGCSTADGKVEKTINLNIVLTAKTLAEFFGYEVDTTRVTDKSIHDKGVTGIRNQKVSDMDNRLEIFNKHENSVCISVHQNTFSDPKYSGAQMFYSPNITQNENFASIMQQKFVLNLQPDNMRETKPCGEELFLCHFSKNPSIMIECGFLSNPEEAALLTDKLYQSKVAFTIFSGINEFIESII